MYIVRLKYIQCYNLVNTIVCRYRNNKILSQKLAQDKKHTIPTKG